MITIKKIVVVFLIISSNLLAQSNFYFSGYVVDLPVYQPAKKILFYETDDQYYNLTRLRLKPTINFSYNSRLDIEYEINSFFLSEEDQGIFSFQSTSSRRQVVDMNWNMVQEGHYILSHYIDRLSFHQEFSFGNLEIGRQRIAWGSGRIWNPTDLFNPINPANFSKIEKDGADALSTMFYLGNFTDLNLVFNPNKEIEKSNYGVRFRTNYSKYDIAFIGGYFDERPVTGLDIAGNLSEAGIRGEGIVSFKNNDNRNTYVKFILGMDYQFTPELYSLVEYHYNGEGKTNKSDYELIKLVNGEILNLSKNYLAVSLEYKITPLLTTTATSISNLNDKSGYFSLLFNYSLTADIYIDLGSQINSGSSLDEYYYYPDVYYLEADFYF